MGHVKLARGRFLNLKISLVAVVLGLQYTISDAVWEVTL